MAATVIVVHGPCLHTSWEVGINMYYRHIPSSQFVNYKYVDICLHLETGPPPSLLFTRRCEITSFSCKQFFRGNMYNIPKLLLLLNTAKFGNGKH